MNESKDIFARYNLPPIHRITPDNPYYDMVEQAKSVRYTKSLPVNLARISAPEEFAGYLKTHIQNDIQIDNNELDLEFTGHNISELNAFINEQTQQNVCIHILSKQLFADETLFVPSFTSIHGHGVIIDANNTDIAVTGKESTQIELTDITIKAPKTCAILLRNCSHSRFHNLTLLNSRDYALICRNHCRYMHIDHCRFIDNKRSGVMIHEHSHHIHVSHCEISGIQHSSNWAAGIVITMLESVSEKQTQDSFEENYFYPKNLDFKVASVPYRNLIECCHIHHNQSSGIYIDGGNGNVVIGNTVAHNDKEGLCLDFYAIANVVLYNSLFKNGYRNVQSDHDLSIDFVSEFGRMADGSAVSKLPNISLDNAAYNIIIKNTVSEAAGDGIKIVRAGFRNVIGLNSITDNNQGHNSTFSFSGILLGSAGCEVPNDSSGLDRLPAIENILFGNHIFGGHLHGIQYDEGSIYNDTIDNFVFKQKSDPVFVKTHPNSILGNNFQSQT